MPELAGASHRPRGGFPALALGALGIVYGDIGTSPLYAMDQLFFGRVSAPTTEEILGGISLVIWTITIIVAVKYAILVLRAQNDGEGGFFALYGLLHEQKRRGTRPLLWALMLGAGLLFGDGIITPAIQRRLRGRRTSGRIAGFEPHDRPDHRRTADCSVRHSVQGYRRHRYYFRPGAYCLVCGHRRVGGVADQPSSGDSGGVQSVLWLCVSPARRRV
jgi:hypothetical protein